MSVLGRFDAHETPEVHAALHHAIRSTPPVSLLLLDLTMTDFFDSHALHSLMTAKEAGRRRGVRLQLAGASAPVRTVMTLAGINGDLTDRTAPERPGTTAPVTTRGGRVLFGRIR